MHLDCIVYHGQSWFHMQYQWQNGFVSFRRDVMRGFVLVCLSFSCVEILARSLLKEKKLSKQLELSTSENDKLAEELQELGASLQRFSAARMSRMLEILKQLAGSKSCSKVEWLNGELVMLLQFLTALGKDKHIGKLSTDLEAHIMPYDLCKELPFRQSKCLQCRRRATRRRR